MEHHITLSRCTADICREVSELSKFGLQECPQPQPQFHPLPVLNLISEIRKAWLTLSLMRLVQSYPPPIQNYQQGLRLLPPYVFLSLCHPHICLLPRLTHDHLYHV